jgi:CRISPR/Cas system Type II protein with McrA/HNH and RuvC-like nuclease domain
MGRKFPTKAKKIARIEKHPQELKENYKAIIEQLNFKPSSEIRKIYEAGQDSSGNKFDTHTKRTLASMIRRRERVENASKVPYFKNILTSLNVIVNPEDNSRSYT